VLGWPEDGQVLIKSMKEGSADLGKVVSAVKMVGNGQALKFGQTNEGLLITLSLKSQSSYTLSH
jgi:alpha-L-fucosidase